jgi:hypothetical protein
MLRITPASTLLALVCAPSLAQTPLLPDIIVDEQRLYDNRIRVEGGRKLLRLSNGTANVGVGKFYIYGGPDNGDGTQQIIQRVYNDDGSFTEYLAGDFVYHPGHAHIHVEAWGQYNLREVLAGNGVGAIVAAGEKTSFCILDLGVHDNSLPGFPANGEFRTCTSTVQGLSVGWVDVYSWSLEGQSIDVTDVPSGTYWLESVVDTENSFVESDETNNVARILVTLGDDTGTIAPDPFEPNDSQAQTAGRPVGAPNSPNLGPAGPVGVYQGLTIHESGQDDYFRFYNPATGTNADFVRIDFSHAAGDLDFDLYNDSGTRLARSEGTGNSETISLNGRAAGWYTVRAFGFNGDTGPSYTLTINPAQNAGPSIAVVNPPAGDVRVRHSFDTYTTTWSVSDPESNPTWVTVYLNASPVLDGNEILMPPSVNTPGASGAHIINSAYVEPGTYWVYASATDGGTMSGAWSAGTVTFFECIADLTLDGVVDSGDLAEFVTLFTAGDAGADVTGDGQVDSGDLAAFVAAFLEGCDGD